MKKYIFAMLCVVSAVHGMEVVDITESIETNMLTLFEASGIDLTDKKVVDMCCNYGTLTARLAQKANCVHGIDQNEQMIEYAKQHHGNLNNLSFEHVTAETFATSTEKYDAAFS